MLTYFSVKIVTRAVFIMNTPANSNFGLSGLTKYQNGTELERSKARSRDLNFVGIIIVSQVARTNKSIFDLSSNCVCHVTAQVLMRLQVNQLAIRVVLFAFTEFLRFLLNYLLNLYQLLACGVQSWRSYPLTGNVGLFDA